MQLTVHTADNNINRNDLLDDKHKERIGRMRASLFYFGYCYCLCLSVYLSLPLMHTNTKKQQPQKMKGEEGTIHLNFNACDTSGLLFRSSSLKLGPPLSRFHLPNQDNAMPLLVRREGTVSTRNGR